MFSSILHFVFRVEGPATAPLMDEPAVMELASKYNKTPAQILLRNLMQRGIIVLPKSVTPERIRSNFQVSKTKLQGNSVQKSQPIVSFKAALTELFLSEALSHQCNNH